MIVQYIERYQYIIDNINVDGYFSKSKWCQFEVCICDTSFVEDSVHVTLSVYEYYRDDSDYLGTLLVVVPSTALVSDEAMKDFLQQFSAEGTRLKEEREAKEAEKQQARLAEAKAAQEAKELAEYNRLKSKFEPTKNE